MLGGGNCTPPVLPIDVLIAEDGRLSCETRHTLARLFFVSPPPSYHVPCAAAPLHGNASHGAYHALCGGCLRRFSGKTLWHKKKRRALPQFFTVLAAIALARSWTAVSSFLRL